MFNNCKLLSNITVLGKWDVSNGEKFRKMFYNTAISDIEPIRDWKMSHAEDLSGMFSKTKISCLAPILNWKIEQVEYFTQLFDESSPDELEILNKAEESEGTLEIKTNI